MRLFAVVPDSVPYDELSVRLHVRLDDPAPAQAPPGERSRRRPTLALAAAPRRAPAAAAAQQRGDCNRRATPRHATTRHATTRHTTRQLDTM